jgi:predicted Rossmann fold nucleotide-binding protein DprA/Smf involved in DNA uptake
VHEHRYGDSNSPPDDDFGLGSSNLNDDQRAILRTLDDAMSLDDLVRRSGLDASIVRTEITMLELSRLIERRGGLISRRKPAPA